MRQHNICCVYVRSVWRGMLDCSPAYLSKQRTYTHHMSSCRITTLTFYIFNKF